MRFQSPMPRYPLWPLPLLLALVAAFFNVWLWPSTELLLGLPVNLVYHAALCVVTSAVMFFVVRKGWPQDADED